ncbi:MAG: UDP-3-O-(3-hydroxymyristoyl)glucosamine N-acyltransferase, partial [Bryobacteraceae bacterium]
MRVRELASVVGAEFEGNGELDIRGAAPLESAGFTDLSFLSSRRAERQARESQAACLVVPSDYVNTDDRTIIRAANPRAAAARIVAKLYPTLEAQPGIHPSASVGPGAVIGHGVTIAANAMLGAGVQIGAGCVIGPGSVVGDRAAIGGHSVLHAHVTIYPDVSVGERVILHSGCVLGADGFGFVLVDGVYEKFPQVGRVEIGNDVEIGANSCVDRAALGVTSIGDGTKLDNLVHIGHNCKVGRNVVIAAQTGLSGGVVVEDGAVIGGQVGIGDKARIESGAVLGSGSGVLTSKIVHAGDPVWGTPARPLKKYLEQLAL